MLSLDSPRWSELQHAYGNASDIPALLKQLKSVPLSKGIDREEPWFSIWSALAHQGDVYSASFASVPHVIKIFSQAPLTASGTFLQFSSWVEICRQRNNIAIPKDLLLDYEEALRQLPHLVGLATDREWDEGFLQSAIAALAVGKGFYGFAEAAQELSIEVIPDFMTWFHGR